MQINMCYKPYLVPRSDIPHQAFLDSLSGDSDHNLHYEDPQSLRQT